MKIILFVLVVLYGLIFSSPIFTQEYGVKVLSDSEKALLDSLPPDQRESILVKMRQADSIGKDLEEAFQEYQTLTERPDQEVFTEEEKKEFLRKTRNWIYGYEQFQSSPTTFAQTDKITIPPNFVLGPGDQVNVVLYGKLNTSEARFINRNGTLNFRHIGPLIAGGLTFEQFEKLIQVKVSTEFLGTKVSVSLGKLRSITVYMLGEAYAPGSYSISALSSLTNLLFVSGGVSEKGSVRNIQVRRNGELVYTYDLYKLFLRGETDGGLRLQDGDVVFIPLYKKTARADGHFRRPHLYEITESDTLEDLIFYAGGYGATVTEKARLELSRINSEARVREIDIFFSTEKNKVSQVLKDGDFLKVFQISSLIPAAITLSGEVEFPGVYSIQKGDRLFDVISRAGGFTEESYSYGAVFLRETIAAIQKESFERTADFLEQAIADAITSGTMTQISGEALRPISLLIARLRSIKPVGRMAITADPLKLKNDPQLNFVLENGDFLHVPSRPSSINIVGEVYSPSSHRFNSETSINDYIDLSGGFRNSADSSNIYAISPNGESIPLKRKLLASKRSNLLPGTTIVVPRNPRPFNWLVMARELSPVFANLATSAAAIAAVSRD